MIKTEINVKMVLDKFNCQLFCCNSVLNTYITANSLNYCNLQPATTIYSQDVPTMLCIYSNIPQKVESTKKNGKTPVIWCLHPADAQELWQLRTPASCLWVRSASDWFLPYPTLLKTYHLLVPVMAAATDLHVLLYVVHLFFGWPLDRPLNSLTKEELLWFSAIIHEVYVAQPAETTCFNGCAVGSPQNLCSGHRLQALGVWNESQRTLVQHVTKDGKK